MILIVLRVMLSMVLFAVTLMIGTSAHGSPLQNEDPNVAGQWKTLSLTQNRIGYELNLRKASTGVGESTHQGTLQFRHREGYKIKSIRTGFAIDAQTKASYQVTRRVRI